MRGPLRSPDPCPKGQPRRPGGRSSGPGGGGAPLGAESAFCYNGAYGLFSPQACGVLGGPGRGAPGQPAAASRSGKGCGTQGYMEPIVDMAVLSAIRNIAKISLT
eukprot:340448-Pyramimonas_sp.AAC.1